MGLNAECEHCGHDSQCGHHGGAGIEECGGYGGFGDVLVLFQVAAVDDHAGACDGQREEGLTHSHDPCFGICQLLPLGHEQKFIACGCTGQECHANGNNHKQHEECGHHNLVQLLNALGGAQQQTSAAQHYDGGVAGNVAQSAAHGGEVCGGIGGHQIACDAAQQTLQYPAQNDGVANGNAQRAKQGNPAKRIAQLALAAGCEAVFVCAQSTCLCAAADGKFCGQTHQTEQHYENNIGNQKCSAAVLAQTVGEQPNVAHANCGANAGQHEAQTCAKAAIAVHCIGMIIFHLFLL